MTDQLLSESRLSLKQLAREQDKSVATIWRWTVRGVRGHVLEAFSIGGRRYSTREAFARWVARTNGEPAARGITPRQRQKQIEAAERELDRMGV